MPLRISSVGEPSNRFIAPRALNDPVTWLSSSFIVTLAVTGNGSRARSAAITGVRRTCGAMRLRAS